MKIDYIKEYQHQLRDIIHQFTEDRNLKDEEVLNYEEVLYSVWFLLEYGRTGLNDLQRIMRQIPKARRK